MDDSIPPGRGRRSRRRCQPTRGRTIIVISARAASPTAPERACTRITSFRSTSLTREQCRPWPGSRGCTTNSDSSIKSFSANACGGIAPAEQPSARLPLEPLNGASRSRWSQQPPEVTFDAVTKGSQKSASGVHRFRRRPAGRCRRGLQRGPPGWVRSYARETFLGTTMRQASTTSSRASLGSNAPRSAWTQLKRRSDAEGS